MPQCVTCRSPFDVRAVDRQFLARFNLPDPIACPDCRMQQRMSFRNERTLYRKPSSLSGKPLISIYAPESPYKVLSQEEWWSDRWDALSYGREFDFNRPFFEQFHDLRLEVPRIALFNADQENSEWCQQAFHCKNSYLCFAMNTAEDSQYCSHSFRIKDTVDCDYVHDTELCYDCLDSGRLYGCIGAEYCQNSNSLLFCYDCIGCSDCAFSTGLRNKKYYFMNERLAPAEYKQRAAALQLHTRTGYQSARDRYRRIAAAAHHRADRNINIENASGNYLENMRSCHHCFDSFDSEDCAYSSWFFHSHHLFDCYGVGKGEWCYEDVGLELPVNVFFSAFLSSSSDCWYSDLCASSQELFGCVSLHHSRFCILNKEYPESDYRRLRARVVEHMQQTGEWGRFFPINLSPFAYNETIAADFFPLSQAAAKKRGFSWREAEQQEQQAEPQAELADDINHADDGVSQQILSCSRCRRGFKVTPAEIAFYRREQLPLPLQCMNCRYFERVQRRLPRRIWQRPCAVCGKSVSTSYSPDRPERVSCPDCYRAAVD